MELQNTFTINLESNFFHKSYFVMNCCLVNVIINLFVIFFLLQFYFYNIYFLEPDHPTHHHRHLIYSSTFLKPIKVQQIHIALWIFVYGGGEFYRGLGWDFIIIHLFNALINFWKLIKIASYCCHSDKSEIGTTNSKPSGVRYDNFTTLKKSWTL